MCLRVWNHSLFDRSVLDETGTDGSEFGRKVASGRRVVVAIKSLINARALKIACA